MRKPVFKGFNITLKDVDCALRISINRRVSFSDKEIRIKEQIFAVCLN